MIFTREWAFFIIQEWHKNRKPDLFNLDVKKNLVLTGTDAADIFNESFVLIYIYLNL